MPAAWPTRNSPTSTRTRRSPAHQHAAHPTTLPLSRSPVTIIAAALVAGGERSRHRTVLLVMMVCETFAPLPRGETTPLFPGHKASYQSTNIVVKTAC